MAFKAIYPAKRKGDDNSKSGGRCRRKSGSARRRCRNRNRSRSRSNS